MRLISREYGFTSLARSGTRGHPLGACHRNDGSQGYRAVHAMARRLALVSLLAAVAIAFADSAIVVLALPDLLKQYDVSINEVAWVVTAYNVALALGALALVP